MWRADRRHPHRQPGMLTDERTGGAGVVEMDVREEQVAEVGHLEAVLAQARVQVVERARRAAVEQRGAVVGLDQVRGDLALLEEVQVEGVQRSHNAIFAIGAVELRPLRWIAAVLVVLALTAPAPAGAVGAPPKRLPRTDVLPFHYRAHDGVDRIAWLLVPAGYDGRPLPLVISPHGRGTPARANARAWGDLPGLGGFAVVCPAGEGRRLHNYSWGDPGQIDDLARMPALVRRHGIDVDLRRVYAVGGSMGGQEVLLLLARHPHLLAGVAAFDPATDMARRYWDFAALRNGRRLQRLARDEIGGTPATAPAAYAERSPDAFARQLAYSGVPLQLWWSSRDRIITDQRAETVVLEDQILGWNPGAPLQVYAGRWRHTAEMKWSTRLPHALVEFGLLRRSQAIQI
jgi:pimeloyl-ACP methyl ester carboxylesterase